MFFFNYFLKRLLLRSLRVWDISVLLRSGRVWVIPKKDSITISLGFVVPECYCVHEGFRLFPERGYTHHEFRVCRSRVLLRSRRVWVVLKEDVFT